MKATDLRKGMTVKTIRGWKVVQSSTRTSEALQRVAFVDGDICLCSPDTEYTTDNIGIDFATEASFQVTAIRASTCFVVIRY